MKTNLKIFIALGALVAPVAMSAQDAPITEPPAGTTIEYSRHELLATCPWGYMERTIVDGYLCKIVYTQDGEVYIQNPVGASVSGTWVKGIMHEDGNGFTVTLPQLVATGVYNKNLYLNRMKYVDATKYEVVPQEQNYMEFDILEDGTVQMKQETLVGDKDPQYCYYPEYGWGITYEQYNNDDASQQPQLETGWYKYLTGNAVYTPTAKDTPITDLPIGAEKQSWLLQYDNVNRLVTVAIDGSNIYLGNLDDSFPDVYIKGRLSNNTAVFPSGQYLGIYSVWSQRTYFMAGSQQVYYVDPATGKEYTRLSFKDELVFNFQEGRKRMEAQEQHLLLNKGNTQVMPIVNIGNPVLLYQDLSQGYAAPRDPEWGNCIDYSSEYNQGVWNFNLSRFDINGNYLPLDKYYYNIYVDGEPYYFSPETYPGLQGMTFDLLYDFSNDQNIGVREQLHTIYYYQKVNEKFAVQAYIIDDKNQKHYSNLMVKYPVGGSGVEGIEADTAVEWYDLQGRRIDNPGRGMYVKVSTDAAGNRRAVKEIRK